MVANSVELLPAISDEMLQLHHSRLATATVLVLAMVSTNQLMDGLSHFSYKVQSVCNMVSRKINVFLKFLFSIVFNWLFFKFGTTYKSKKSRRKRRSSSINSNSEIPGHEFQLGRCLQRKATVFVASDDFGRCEFCLYDTIWYTTKYTGKARSYHIASYDTRWYDLRLSCQQWLWVLAANQLMAISFH